MPLYSRRNVAVLYCVFFFFLNDGFINKMVQKTAEFFFLSIHWWLPRMLDVILTTRKSPKSNARILNIECKWIFLVFKNRRQHVWSYIEPESLVKSLSTENCIFIPLEATQVVTFATSGISKRRICLTHFKGPVCIFFLWSPPVFCVTVRWASL